MNKKKKSISASHGRSFVDSLSGMMMNRRRHEARAAPAHQEMHDDVPHLAHPGRGPVLRRHLLGRQRGNGPQAVAHLILMSVSFLLGLLWIFMGIANLFRFYQRRRRYHSGAEEASLIADEEGLTPLHEISAPSGERWNDLQLCALAPDVIAILHASAGMILFPHTDVLEAAVRVSRWTNTPMRTPWKRSLCIDRS